MKYKLLLLLFITLFLAFLPPCTAESITMRTGESNDPRIVFKIPAYNTILKFKYDISLSHMGYPNKSYSEIDYYTFYNISMRNGPQISTLTIELQLQQANMTITQLMYRNQFKATLNAPEGTLAIITLANSYLNTIPKSVTIEDQQLTNPKLTYIAFNAYAGNCYYYDSTTKTLYIKAETQSPTQIIVDWNPPPPSPPPDDPPDDVPPSPPPDEPPDEPPDDEPPSDTYSPLIWGLLMTVIIVVVCIGVIIKKRR